MNHSTVCQDSWRSALTRSVARSRQAALRRLAGEIGAIQERCQRRVAHSAGFQHLADDLDGELSVLSASFATDLNTLYHYSAERTLVAAFGRMPSTATYAWVAADVDATHGDRPGVVLVVTPDGRVETARITRFTATAPTVPPPPVRVTLAHGCYRLWRDRPDVRVAEIELWLRRALDSVAAELLNQMMSRCHEVHDALARSVADLLAE
jgi:hypothetical protein